MQNCRLLGTMLERASGYGSRWRQGKAKLGGVRGCGGLARYDRGMCVVFRLARCVLGSRNRLFLANGFQRPQQPRSRHPRDGHIHRGNAHPYFPTRMDSHNLYARTSLIERVVSLCRELVHLLLHVLDFQLLSHSPRHRLNHPFKDRLKAIG